MIDYWILGYPISRQTHLRDTDGIPQNYLTMLLNSEHEIPIASDQNAISVFTIWVCLKMLG